MNSQQYKFNNLNIKVWPAKDAKPSEYLVSGVGNYVVDELDEDEYEACFESVVIHEIIGKNGKVPKEELSTYEESVLMSLNRNEGLCRALAR